METEALTEIELFQRFLAEQIENGGRNLSVEESIEAFRAYQRDLERLKADVQVALDQSHRGESKPFDPEEMKARVTKRLAEKGITD